MEIDETRNRIIFDEYEVRTIGTNQRLWPFRDVNRLLAIIQNRTDQFIALQNTARPIMESLENPAQDVLGFEASVRELRGITGAIIDMVPLQGVPEEVVQDLLEDPEA